MNRNVIKDIAAKKYKKGTTLKTEKGTYTIKTDKLSWCKYHPVLRVDGDVIVYNEEKGFTKILENEKIT